MAEKQIPDRSAEPAVQESLDRGPRSTTAANSNDVPPDAPPEEARDDEGNAMGAEPKNGEASNRSNASGEEADDTIDDEEVEERTGVPATSKNLSGM